MLASTKDPCNRINHKRNTLIEKCEKNLFFLWKKVFGNRSSPFASERGRKRRRESERIETRNAARRLFVRYDTFDSSFVMHLIRSFIFVRFSFSINILTPGPFIVQTTDKSPIFRMCVRTQSRPSTMPGSVASAPSNIVFGRTNESPI